MKFFFKRGLLSIFTALSMASTVSAQPLNSGITSESSSQFHFGNGVVYGRVFNDRDGDGRSRFFERGLRRITVYLDENDNETRDADERSTRTNRWGFYQFRNVPSGDYVVRQEVPFGWRNVSGGEGDTVVPTIVPSSRINVTPQIIGGDITAVNEYPFMVAVGITRDGQFRQFCGGVLITDRWVATASHCTEGLASDDAKVLVGTNNVLDGSGQVIGVTSLTLHPDYIVQPDNPDDPFGVVGGYDIALWELAEPIALQDSGLQTVAMLNRRNAFLANDDELATAVGWGVNDLQSSLLQDVHVPIFDTEQCRSVYSTSINFDTQICGGAPEGGIDACQGDSGGPLLVRDMHRERWKLAGITSYGNGCAESGNPGVWARVSELSEWVQQAAVETSRFHRIKVRPFNVVRANFGNQRTRYEPRTPIEPRWQLVNLVTNDTDQRLNFSWRIIDESPIPRAFDCAANSDLLTPTSSTELECFEGDNEVSLPSLDDGVYASSLVAAFEDTQFSRIENMIVGFPPTQQVAGALTADDIIDPDYQSRYYLDYFDLDNLPTDRSIAVRITSKDLEDLFVVIYDRDEREALGFGGEIQNASAFGAGSTADLYFDPQEGVNYLLGVSSFTEELEGEYEVSVVNGGSAVPTSLGTPTESALDWRGLRKLPKLKTIVSYPIAN